MHELHLLVDIVIILSVALVVGWLFTRLKLPTIVGFLASGILLGPDLLGVVANEGEIAVIAEIGVVLLHFSNGLGLSIKELRRLASFVFAAGGLQLGITTGVIALIAYAAGYPTSTAVFFGFLGGLSSTAIVLTSLRESDELAAVHGRGMIGVLLFQDLAVVPLLLLVPFLAGTTRGLAPVVWTLAKAGGMIGAVWLVASYIFPWVAERVARTRKRELFTLFTVLVAIGTAAASGAAGVSLALGAFLAGLVVSESPYSDQMTAEVEPFKDVFNSLFFVSMGLLVDPGLFVQYPLTIAGLFGGVLLIKFAVTGAVTAFLGYGFRVAVLVGLGLCQVGEFSFILAREGIDAGLLTDTQYGLFLATAVLTMAVTPFFLAASTGVVERLMGSWFERLSEMVGMTDRHLPGGGGEGRLDDHVVIVGFGTNGQHLAESLKRFESPYTIVELNPNTVLEYADREPIHYGDASREPILQEIGAEQAHSLIVTAADREASRSIVSAAKRLNPDLYVIARVRFSRDLRDLYRAGADRVVVEEFETALEIVAKTLEAYEVSPGNILREKDAIRVKGSGKTGRPGLPDEPRARHTLRFLSSKFHTDFVRLPRQGRAVGQTIGALGIREKTGATIIAVERNQELIEHPTPDFALETWDQVLLIGPPDAIDAARLLLSEAGTGA